LVFQAFEYSNGVTIIAGGIILGFMASFLPAIAQPYTRKITGSDDLAIGHYNLFAYALSGLVGTLFSKHKEKSTETIKFPKWLSFFRDFLISSTIVMLILFRIYFNQKPLRNHLNSNFAKIKISNTSPASKRTPHKEICFNQKCHRNNLIFNFAKISVSNTSQDCKQTRRILINNLAI
jgi:hypothetical protein